MKKLNLSIVEHHESEIEISSDGYVYISVEVEFGEIPDAPIYVETQLVCMKDDTIVTTSDLSSSEIDADSPRVYLSDSFHAGNGQIPDSYSVNFRAFIPDEVCTIDTPIPPEIARQSGAYLIHTPKKGFLSREKWVSGAVSIDSIVVKNVAGEDDALFVNVSSLKPIETGFQITCASGDSDDYTIFKILEKPQAASDQLRVHLTGDLTVSLAGFSSTDWFISEKAAFAGTREAEEESHGSEENTEYESDDYESTSDIELESESLDETPIKETTSLMQSVASDSSDSWIVSCGKLQNELIEDLDMTITRFDCEAPDDDGDISVDLEFEIKNESNKDVSLIKYDLVVEQDGVGPIGGQTRNTEDCLLDAGEVFSGSSWLRINENLMTTGNSEVVVKLFARVYEREFFKIGSIDVPAELNDPVSLTKEIDSELLDSRITVAMMRRSDGDEDSNEDLLEFKTSITNKTDGYIEDIELRVVLLDRTGAEDDDTYDSLDTLGPHSGTYVEPSFWGKPKSKLKGATVDIFLKAHRLIGTRVISETRRLSG